MSNKTNTVIFTIHNKEKTIRDVLLSLVSSLSNFSTDLIIIFDGCTDKSESIVKETILENNLESFVKIHLEYTDDIWETKANNFALRKVQTEFATIVQDDMLIKQYQWDLVLLKVFIQNNIFAVSGRSAHDFKFKDRNFIVQNLIGREYPFGDKTIFGKIIAKILFLTKFYNIFKLISPVGFRITVNRGPLLLNMKYVKELNFFDEIFAPFELDDVDLCCRAFKKWGLLSACKPIFFRMVGGSKKSNAISQKISIESIFKNTQHLISRHSDLSL